MSNIAGLTEETHSLATDSRVLLRRRTRAALPHDMCRAEGGGGLAEPGHSGRDVTKVHLLRCFDLRHNEVSVAVPPAGQRLLAFLALQSGPVRRVYAAGVLWIDFSQEKANANLRSALWRLGRFPWPLVEATPTHLALSTQVSVDVHEAVGIARRINGEAAACEETELERIVRAGALLPDWYDEWIIIERERFRQVRLHALEALCYALTREGRHEQAIEAGLAAVADEPLRESAHRAIMRAHLAEGNRGEALRQYDLCRTLLADQLGVGPSSEMERLRDHCVSGDVVVTAPR